MKKKLLSPFEVNQIAVGYANSDDTVTMSHFADEYGVSESTISKALRYAVSNGKLSKQTAQRISEKSNRNSGLVKERILGERERRQQKSEEEYKKLLSRRSELEHQIEVFNETYSSSDEFPYSLENLQDELDSLNEQIKIFNS